ncbi:MAG: glycine cleavage system aminomethyltransferase GcvT [Muribaculaceae bacterium]|nr:glycine cleavage system aminomethyltransferase GcvT [Muribaculaceae bacterium]
MSEEIKKTCLHDRHTALGAQMSPFGGFDMPIQYQGITEEHNAVRSACGVFDVSHMGEVNISGPDAERFVSHIFTNDIYGAPDGKIFYGMMLHPDGGTVDDLLVYRRAADSFLLVINASNIDKDIRWIRQCSEGFNVEINDLSPVLGELAVQGPEAEAVMGQVLGIPCADLAFYTFREALLDGAHILVSRTGYTGEDGFEIYADHATTVALWDRLMESGRACPCGLGCRDTLRFEVGLPLYGHELADDISPIESGLSMFVKLDKEGTFIGRDAVAQQKAEGPARRVVGLEMADKAIPRAGYPVLDTTGKQVGTVTTGYRSPSTDRSVAMALVDASVAAKGTPLLIQIRRRTYPATVVPKKFYKKSYKK